MIQKTIILNGAGPGVRVTLRGPKPAKVTVLGSTKPQNVVLSQNTSFKFAS